MERSKAVIAAPCDKPIMPSYWFFDSSSDHHLTCRSSQHRCSIAIAQLLGGTYRFVPSVRCVHIVLQIVIQNPPGPRGRMGRVSVHRRAIDVMKIGDISQSGFQRETVERKGGP